MVFWKSDQTKHTKIEGQGRRVLGDGLNAEPAADETTIQSCKLWKQSDKAWLMDQYDVAGFIGGTAWAGVHDVV